jgi:hypothetical protein
MFTRARVHNNQEPSTQQSRAEKVIQRANDPATIIQRAQALPASALSASDILALQRTIGNRAVQQLLASQLAAPQASAATARPVIQAKLMVGPANDHYEQEADRVAQQVTSEPTAKSGAATIQRQTDEDEPVQRKPLAASITPLVQRQTEADEPLQAKPDRPDEGVVADSRFENRLQANRGSGSPLPEPVRLHMESRFGADFSRVRVHTGTDAAEMNRGVRAHAFTHGSDIYFGSGAFEPNTEQGKQLLAHELTHTLQQGGARSEAASIAPNIGTAPSGPRIQRQSWWERLFGRTPPSERRPIVSSAQASSAYSTFGDEPRRSVGSASSASSPRDIELQSMAAPHPSAAAPSTVSSSHVSSPFSAFSDDHQRSVESAPSASPHREVELQSMGASHPDVAPHRGLESMGIEAQPRPVSPTMVQTIDQTLGHGYQRIERAITPVQERQKPALVSSGVSGLGSISSGLLKVATLGPGGNAVGGLLGGLAGPINVASGIHSAVRGDSPRQRAEGALSAVGGLGQTFTGVTTAGAGISALLHSTTAPARFMTAAALPAQIAMGGVDMVRGVYGLVKAGARQGELQELVKEFNVNSRIGQFAHLAAQYQERRMRTSLLGTVSGGLAMVGGAMMLTGVGAIPGLAFLGASAVLKGGQILWGWLRDKIQGKEKAKAKRETEDQWVQYADARLHRGSEFRHDIQKVLKAMGMQQQTLDKLDNEQDAGKRQAVLRAMLMRR